MQKGFASVSRPRRISPRFTAADHARLTAAAAAAGMTATAWLRRAALRHLDALPPAPPPAPSPAAPASLAPLAAPSPSPGPSAPLGRTSATRFTPDQHAAVVERARDCCLSVSAYIRVLVLGGTPLARRSEVRSAIVAVNRVGTNLNQLVKLASSGLLLPPELLRAIHALRAEIGTLRQAFLAALRDEPDRKGHP
jgi:hypothetical protein